MNEIQITGETIEKSLRRLGNGGSRKTDCPIALALETICDARNISVGIEGSSVIFSDESIPCDLPSMRIFHEDSVRDMIRLFDKQDLGTKGTLVLRASNFVRGTHFNYIMEFLPNEE